MLRDTGSSIRIYNLAKGLVSAGHHVRVVIPKEKMARESTDGFVVESVEGFCPKALLQVISKLLGVSRPTALFFYDLLFILRVSRIVREYDVVQIEQQSSSGLLIPLIRKVLKRPVIVDCHDVFQALRVKHTNILRRMFETFLEKLAYKSADLLLTVSDEEKRYLASIGLQKCKIEVVPNGVDTNLFAKSQEQRKTLRKKYDLKESQIVVFVGNLDYLPNREAVQILSSVIAPRVMDEIKDVKFFVIGRNREKLELPKLTFTGAVNSVSDILNISDVAVAPLLHGSGTRLKILEYFSCGLPVVSTSTGAEGLNIKDGVNIFIEDDLEDFSLCVIKLLKDKNLSTTVGKAARVLATSTYDWSQIIQRLEIALNLLFS